MDWLIVAFVLVPHADRPSDATTAPRIRTVFRTFSPLYVGPALHARRPKTLGEGPARNASTGHVILRIRFTSARNRHRFWSDLGASRRTRAHSAWFRFIGRGNGVSPEWGRT